MTDTPEDRNNPENESDKPTPEGSSETAPEETEVLHDEEPSLTAASADSDEPSRSGPFNLGRTGRRIAVGVAVVAAFFSGMVLYGALDDRDSDGGRPELVSAPDGESGMPGMPPGGVPGMPGGGPGGPHGGGPGWSHDGDDEGHESEDGDHEGDEDGDGDHEGDDDRGEYEDESEEGMMPPGYQAPPGGQNQPAPMESGQS